MAKKVMSTEYEEDMEIKVTSAEDLSTRQDDDGNESLHTIDVDDKLYSDWEEYVQEATTRGPWPFVSLKSFEDEKKKNVKNKEEDDNPDEEEAESNYKSKMITLSEADDRETWGGRFDFILSMVGNAVGLGNVWRFPYVAFANGGGAFLVPYFIMMFVIGISGVFIECIIGQYSAVGTAHGFYNCIPLFRGVGLASLINCVYITYYYNAIIGWCYFYFGASFSTTVPWSRCDHSFNTDFCFSDQDFVNCIKNSSSNIFINQKCYGVGDDKREITENLSKWYGDKKKNCIFTNLTFCSNSSTATQDIKELFHLPPKLRVTSSEEYFFHGVLNKSPSLAYLGYPSWKMMLCLAVTWIVNFLCLIKGIKTSGKVVYFTATFPYLLLTILLVRALTLEGSEVGINYYMQPDWSKLSEIKVWYWAAAQILFSIGNGNCTMPTLASYNKFHKNIIFDVFFVCICNCVTSFVAGFAIFGALGHLAHIVGVDVQDVAESGAGLAFIAYPDLVSNLPFIQFWSALFFLMLVTLGLDSSMCLVESINTFIVDTFPRLRQKKTFVVLGVCITFLILSIPLACPAGVHIVTLMDQYGATPTLLWVALLENIMIAVFYGVGPFLDDLVEMTRKSVVYKFKYLAYLFYWVLAPVTLAFLLGYNFYAFKPLHKEEEGNPFPVWSDIIGWVVESIPYMVVPIFAIVAVVKMGWRDSLRSTNTWRKNALRQNKMDKYRGQERIFNYKLEKDRIVRTKM